MIVILLCASGCMTTYSIPAPDGIYTSITASTTSTTVPTIIPSIVPVIVPMKIATPIPEITQISITTLPLTPSIPDHLSKYKDYSVLPSGNSGTVYIHTSGWGDTATIHINSTENHMKELYTDLLPDGSSNILNLDAGNYTAYLPDKYGNRTEQHQFFVGKDSTTYVFFDGYSYRASTGTGSC